MRSMQVDHPKPFCTHHPSNLVNARCGITQFAFIELESDLMFPALVHTNLQVSDRLLSTVMLLLRTFPIANTHTPSAAFYDTHLSDNILSRKQQASFGHNLRRSS